MPAKKPKPSKKAAPPVELDFETFVRAAMATGKPPKAKPVAKPVCGTCRGTGIFKGKKCPDCSAAYVEGETVKPRLDKPRRGKK